MSQNNLKTVDTPWSEGALLICQKCGGSINTITEPTKLAESLKDELRGIVRAAQQGPKVRVMISGCLSVCEDNLQALAYVPVEGTTEVMTYDPLLGKDEVISFLKSKLNK